MDHRFQGDTSEKLRRTARYTGSTGRPVNRPGTTPDTDRSDNNLAQEPVPCLKDGSKEKPIPAEHIMLTTKTVPPSSLTQGKGTGEKHEPTF